ncbi:CPCC family cysteine-rich protein [Chryseobacterium antibioticum]|uniref:CPCC family cysteine-rich protein n=1 Tax=Chryseobacterium pyrolae TaxID=2987481 RepID=A0ABT2IGH2_9FLAO|nr:CPCC family cysteine-rich protein [Chryseobacterium pyrolae]MCT2407694.1 CPCC family cysteine-rich protein [Chryseobacterium pyrolae]
MIELDLNSAINILSLDEYSKMTIQEREKMIDDEGLDKEELFEYIRDRYIGIRLSYIEGKIRDLYQLSIDVKGIPKELFTCHCCNYKTILEKGNYQICKVCFWEDDGGHDESKYSHVNHMTLKEAKDNFKTKGAILDRFLKFVDIEGKVKYYKNDSLI